MICTAANALWLAASLPEARRFRRALSHVRREQRQLLREILRANADTEFGRRHAFATISTEHEYRARVPVRSYEDLAPEIDRIAAGENGILVRERVRLFEPTSGSTAATKLVPYTASLQREFERGIQPWIADLFLSDPDLMRGRAYWAVSPAITRRPPTAGGVPVGFADDSDYLGGRRRALVRSVMAVPESVRFETDPDLFRYQTLLALVRSASLRLISVWNPTFFTALLRDVARHADRLLADLQHMPRRARAVQAALKASSPAELHARLWPRLRLVSCWMDANAAAPASHLAALLPHARMQPKGVIATEGFVSLPLERCDAAALAVRCHFFEFAPVDSLGSPDESSTALAHELERDRRYTVLLTTSGGLYRYRLHDVVEVLGHERECPLIRFVGKHEYVSDWIGEKLHEAHVAGVLGEVCSAVPAFGPAFAMLACDPALAPASYVLYTESSASDATLATVAAAVEDRLRHNFQYDYARLAGQLGAVRVFRVERGAETYVSAATAGGQRAGSVKMLSLDRRDGWSRRFRGQFIPIPLRSTPSGCAPLRHAR